MQNKKRIIMGLILFGCFTFFFSINGLANAFCNLDSYLIESPVADIGTHNNF